MWIEIEGEESYEKALKQMNGMYCQFDKGLNKKPILVKDPDPENVMIPGNGGGRGAGGGSGDWKGHGGESGKKRGAKGELN